jgi:hypothetical protein
MNIFERDGRAAKLALLLAHVPTAAMPEACDAIADRLASFSKKEREAFAEGAGCKRPPSSQTWSELVGAVRVRKAVA